VHRSTAAAGISHRHASLLLKILHAGNLMEIKEFIFSNICTYAVIPRFLLPISEQQTSLVFSSPLSSYVLSPTDQSHCDVIKVSVYKYD
jgi:hypothetical protein